MFFPEVYSITEEVILKCHSGVQIIGNISNLEKTVILIIGLPNFGISQQIRSWFSENNNIQLVIDKNLNIYIKNIIECKN